MITKQVCMKYFKEFSEKAEKYRDAYWDNGKSRTRTAAERYEDIRDICEYAYKQLLLDEEYNNDNNNILRP